MSYQIRRVDDNQKAIVNVLRGLGASVQILSEVGRGCPDILVGIFGQNILVELKDGSKPPSAQKLTRYEQIFFDAWKGQVCIINSEQEAIDLITKLRFSDGKQVL
jgi:hypothetical protein